MGFLKGWKPLSGLTGLVKGVFDGVGGVVESVGKSDILNSQAASIAAGALNPASALGGKTPFGGQAGGAAPDKMFDQVTNQDNSWIWKLGLGILAFAALVWGVIAMSSKKGGKNG